MLVGHWRSYHGILKLCNVLYLCKLFDGQISLSYGHALQRYRATIDFGPVCPGMKYTNSDNKCVDGPGILHGRMHDCNTGAWQRKKYDRYWVVLRWPLSIFGPLCPIVKYIDSDNRCRCSVLGSSSKGDTTMSHIFNKVAPEAFPYLCRSCSHRYLL